MNIVRAKRLGQFPGEGIAADLTLGPQDTSTDNYPMYYDAGLLIAEQGAPAPAPTATVPQPPATDTTGQTGFLPWQMNITPVTPATAQAPAPGQISPAPHVNIPTSTATRLLSGIPMVAWVGIGVLGILAISSGGGRRRR